ncbi:hypothetical protein M446_6937 [Methylobacterium sp. 4-46]|uniref:hypothetical protein n=1 Tax=unclassified Methylobacterium TaxID=2615210 RepID=UPI000152E078|nr:MULTISPECIES: hypothetical protein [Methylobacterium]ACA21171.1 hypothetical protein M446_6937 [Methylobacterium sp. 4-46]WFT80317.1 hypothetical protein QA634_35020 [Methylobacterium nodulans]
MEALAMPLASAAVFTLGCAILQVFGRYAERFTPVLAWTAMLLCAAVLMVASVQHRIARGGDDQMLLPDPWLSTIP